MSNKLSNEIKFISAMEAYKLYKEKKRLILKSYQKISPKILQDISCSIKILAEGGASILEIYKNDLEDMMAKHDCHIMLDYHDTFCIFQMYHDFFTKLGFSVGTWDDRSDNPVITIQWDSQPVIEGVSQDEL